MDVRLIEAASEIGAGKRGASMGMSALRVAAWKNGSDLFGHAEESILRDENDVLYEDDSSPNAHHIDGLIRFESDLAYEVYKFLRSNIFPMVIGGDHSIAIGSISGTKMAFPHERLGVVWIDAHADLHSPWTTPSGNVHGMPLALLMNIEKKGRNKPRVFTLDTWDRLRKIGMSGPKLLPSDLVFIGLRDYEPEEAAIIREHGIKVITVDELRQRGADQVVAETLAHLTACERIHVSFDVDSLDPSISVGTGTPVPGGLSLPEVRTLLTGLCVDAKTATLDVVEINPALDTNNAMAEAVLTVLEPLFPILRNR
ncbi:MAG: arginase [Bacteroidetes bacterium]|nr:arginase [Bacteroidota bacterium]MBX7127786.1 arginase [Flavobacteriales bacterium]MCC6653720.1 arginase [Flavobacteriales bacterium]HMU15322.1 arginase [Flavobacteriales bacterium]HMW97525.1 arginase [Flavobacteriales bacterium]